MVEDYVRQSHGHTHHFRLKVLDVFRINREGEEGRFEPWKQFENRQLLWHGSRLTNYVGILSQGLRIAPPEAPVVAYAAR